jgi:hypothetical protein
MILREKLIKDYFQYWIKKNSLLFSEIFDVDIIYSECYGPEYQGIEVILRWFEDWNKRGTVLVWDIKEFIHQGNMTAVEWYFKCESDGDIGAFEGVSLIEFNTNNKITRLKEFQSKIPHYYPYK